MGASPSDDRVEKIRWRLVDISDELGRLAPDDYPGKHRLHVEADDLRGQLKELSTGDVETRREWAERAGRKGAHAGDDAAPEASIVSPHEGRGSSWA